MVTPPALEVPRVPQRTAAQVAAEMAQVQAARHRATQAERAALRARAEIDQLNAQLPTLRRQASLRTLEQMMRGF